MKDALIRAAAASGAPRLFHRIFHPGDAAILMYHAVTDRPLPVRDWCFIEAEPFRRQMSYLKRHFDVVPLGSLVKRLKAKPRRPAAVVTFDDGFQNNLDVAFPILRELGIPATIFLTTDLIGSDDTVWFCRLHRALMETSAESLEWNGRRIALRGPSERAAGSAALQRSLKALKPEETETETSEIVQRLGLDPRRPVEPASPFRMLSEQGTAQLAASGLVEMGAHTRRHRILSRLSSREKQEEIAGSVAAVTRLSGSTCRLFAYPNGQDEDFDPEAVSMVVQAGVETAVTTMSGPNDAETPRLELRRYGVGQGMSDAMFRLVVHHAAHRLRR